MGASSKIEHVVVLMLENHSFDHLLGFLRHPRGEEFNGLVGKNFFNVGSDCVPVPATMDGTPDGMDPDHSHAGIQRQLAGFGGVAANGGFVLSYEAAAGKAAGPQIMRCLGPDTYCEVLARLATEFAVCTAWHCSVPGATWPNRNFAHAATSDGTVDIELGFYDDLTIFEVLEKAGKSWRIYYDGAPQVWCYPRLWKPRVILDFLFRCGQPRIGNWHELEEFFRHVSNDELPSYSFIEPAHHRLLSHGPARQTNSQHPGNNPCGNDNDFWAGEQLIKNIYEALRLRQDVFAKTLLVIVYDEHGGFYDHVSPPAAPPPGDPISAGKVRRLIRLVRSLAYRRRRRGDADFDFASLGVRVPAVLVSPWIAPNTVVTERFDHASIPATLRSLFAPNASSLTARDQAANTFHQVVDNSTLTSPRTNPKGPTTPAEHPLPDLSDYPRSRNRGKTSGSPDHPPTDLDIGLDRLERDVRAALRRNPFAVLLRWRGSASRRRGRGRPEDLFTKTARGARRE